jgi:hypothetical protein
VADQEYYPEEYEAYGDEPYDEALKDEYVPNDGEAAITWDDLRAELRQDIQQQMAAYDANGQRYYDATHAQPQPSIEEAYDQHWADQQALLQHHLGRELSDTEVAGMNHVLNKDPTGSILEVYQRYKNLSPADKAQIAHRDREEKQEEARVQGLFQRGEVLHPSQWSDDPDTRRAQRLAYAQAKAAGIGAFVGNLAKPKDPPKDK